MAELPRYAATRYVQPLREGGSLPAVVDTDGGGLFVVKFRGAGQGAEGARRRADRRRTRDARSACRRRSWRSCRSRRASVGASRTRRSRSCCGSSHGINVGLRYLEGAFNFDVGAAGDLISPELAARIVWLDAFTTNPDRTARNPNMLIWERRPWLIDHGAALYAHHDWDSVDDARTRTPFQLIRSHVLLPNAATSLDADRFAVERLDRRRDSRRGGTVPDSLFADARGAAATSRTANEARERYVRYLTTRLARAARVRAGSGEGAGAAAPRAADPPQGPAMSAKSPVEYDFAVLRVVPRVHLGAFVNVGVVMHARTAELLALRVLTDVAALRARLPGVDVELLARYLRSCEAICGGRPVGRPGGARTAVRALPLAHGAEVGRAAELADPRGSDWGSGGGAGEAVWGVRTGQTLVGAARVERTAS